MACSGRPAQCSAHEEDWESHELIASFTHKEAVAAAAHFDEPRLKVCSTVWGTAFELRLLRTHVQLGLHILHTAVLLEGAAGGLLLTTHLQVLMQQDGDVVWQQRLRQNILQFHCMLPEQAAGQHSRRGSWGCRP